MTEELDIEIDESCGSCEALKEELSEAQKEIKRMRKILNQYGSFEESKMTDIITKQQQEIESYRAKLKKAKTERTRDIILLLQTNSNHAEAVRDIEVCYDDELFPEVKDDKNN